MTEDLEDYKAAFVQWDTKRDGVLTEDEISENITEICNYFNMEEPDVRRILRSADSDKNGEIDFTEFVTAAYDKRKLLSETNLKKVFAMLDVNDDGFISKEEIMEALGGSELNLPESVQNSTDDFWGEIMASIDSDKDG